MPYTIGEVARMMNIAPSTLRYYEKEGLLSLGVRASNGQRTYTDDDIATLSIIEYLKFCGLPLKEIRSFLPLIRPGGETLGVGPVGVDPAHHKADAGHAVLDAVIAKSLRVFLRPGHQLVIRRRRGSDQIAVPGDSGLA